ncbi:MAG: hypothetical protein CFE26_03595 [Verrucomicrobiales bacterium VVV1]|nr:MAG: hypothetical protein CFE26_03595 [Verrucomicrobiales bacterium VVV1]
MVFRGGRVIGTLPTTPPNWIVTEGSAPPRVTKPGESFVIPIGSTLHFSEKHQSYRVTAQLKPDQGLIIESRFDGRSFGDEIVERNYFISVK